MVTAPIATPSAEELATAAPGFNPGAAAGRGVTLLRAAFGQDEANHGTARYSVGNDGLIRVPFEAVGPLTNVGGFVLAKAGDDAISVGTLKLRHEDATGCSYAGLQYFADVNGDVLVPAEATSELLAHGFVPVFEKAMAASSGAKPSRYNHYIRA
jgi:hypothetical protein